MSVHDATAWHSMFVCMTFDTSDAACADRISGSGALDTSVTESIAAL